MKDQAQGLREIFKDDNTEKGCRIIAITSGKGGVGKTNFTVNMAIKLSQLGYRTVIVDADIGLANIDVLLGIIPKYNLTDLLFKNKSAKEIIYEGPEGIKLIFGGSGIEELIDPDIDNVKNLVNGIEQLENIADIILIDTGAGLSEIVLTFLNASDQIILLTTPEPTSVTDAYAMVKVLSNHNYDRSINLVVNRATNSLEARNVLDQFCNVVNRFLNVKLEKLGYVMNDDYVCKAVKRQQPFSLVYPNCNASKCIDLIARNLVNRKLKQQDSISSIKAFFSKLLKTNKGW